MKKRLIAAGLMLAMFTGTAAAVNSYTKTITVEYGVNLLMDGETPTLTDVNGNPVQPFTYNGTTYVPLRAVSDFFGAGIGYDEATQTAIVDNDLSTAYELMHMIESTMNTGYIDAKYMQMDLALNMPDKASITSMYDNDKRQFDATVQYAKALSGIQNVYVDYISENCLNKLDDLYDTYNKMLNQYQKYCDTKNETYLHGTLTYFDEMIDNYFECKKSIDDWYAGE